jgi:Protein of unknown function (DUF2849).
VAVTEERTKAKLAKARQQALQAVTANRLIDGLVVFLAAGERWVEQVADVELARDQSAADALMAVAERDVMRRIVVGPYLIEMTETPDGLSPSLLRERIRADGPTARTDCGSKAEEGSPHVSL